MIAPKYRIPLFAEGLKTAGPKIGVLNFTEMRIGIRPFPKDDAERAFYQYLLGQMLASPDRAPMTRAELKRFCRAQFKVTAGSFDYCWPEALAVSSASWNRPGRRPRQKI